MARMSLTQPSAPPAARQRSPFIVRGLKSLAIAAAIAVFYALVFGHRLVPSLVYVLSITLGCWFFIDGGRVVISPWVNRRQAAGTPGRDGWPGWPWMSAILLVGTLLGAVLGNTLADALMNQGGADRWLTQPRQILGMLVVALIPGLAATLLARNRERLATIEAQAQHARREAAENQLRLLESQLEPHMLFNTLANLRVLIGLDPARAQAMLDQLIAFLRATLNASRVGRHALSAEFSRLADYLALMQVRMGARLQVRLDLPDALATVGVPPLLLQPLVENAVKHGLEPKVDGGCVEIVARRDAAALVLTVHDTGVGLAAPAGQGTRFGLQQVRDRLSALYGDGATLTLEPAADGGTLATVRLPLTEAPS
jgi:signal transduction histidine kinase